MDFIKELELYLENTPELYGQKLVIVKAMRSGDFDEKQTHRAIAAWVSEGVKQYFTEAGVEGSFHDYDVLVAKYIKNEKALIAAGAYKELDLLEQEETLAAEGAEPAVAAPPEVETAPAPKVEFTIEDFKDEDKLAAALAKVFADPNEELEEGETETEYQKIFNEIKDSIDYNQTYEWRGMADFEADGDEYTVIRNEEVANLISVDEIQEMMNSEPESFAVGEWLKEFYYISDTDKRIISGEEADSYIGDMDEDDLVKQYGTDDEKEKHDQDPLDSDEIETIRERANSEYSDEKYKEMEKDPLAYCLELGYEIGGKNHPSFLQLDVNAAAQHANDTDGWAHQLSRYDGNYEETADGLVYFKR